MAYEINNYSLKITLVAGADLSAAQYTFVKLDATGGVIQCSAVTDAPIGVLQNNPSSGQEAEVVVAGGTKVKVGAAITAGNLQTTALGTSAAGLAVAKVLGTDTTNFSVGRPLSAAGGANEIITAVINCAAPNRAS
jgi:hypothetical protein